MAKLKNDIVILLITLIASITVIVLFILYLINNNSEWIGFWGSLLGSIIAILGIYWQFDRQKKEDRRRDELGAINFFLIELHKIENSTEDWKELCLNLSTFNVIRVFEEQFLKNFIFRGFSRELIKDMLLKISLKDFYGEILNVLNFYSFVEDSFKKNFLSQQSKGELLNKIYEKLNEDKIKENPNLISGKDKELKTLIEEIQNSKPHNAIDLLKKNKKIYVVINRLLHIKELHVLGKELLLYHTCNRELYSILKSNSNLDCYKEKVTLLIGKLEEEKRKLA